MKILSVKSFIHFKSMAINYIIQELNAFFNQSRVYAFCAQAHSLTEKLSEHLTH